MGYCSSTRPGIRKTAPRAEKNENNRRAFFITGQAHPGPVADWHAHAVRPPRESLTEAGLTVCPHLVSKNFLRLLQLHVAGDPGKLHLLKWQCGSHRHVRRKIRIFYHAQKFKRILMDILI